MFTILNLYKRYDPNQLTYLNVDNIRKNLKKFGDLIFVNSMSDTFHEQISFEKVDELMKVLAEFPDKQFQFVTKRANRMRQYFEIRKCPNNIWLGVTIEDQAHTFRIDTLRRKKSQGIKFISFEPLIGRIYHADLSGINLSAGKIMLTHGRCKKSGLNTCVLI